MNQASTAAISQSHQPSVTEGMLGSPIPASASVQTVTSSATPASPTRPSRLRGLSYLRNYTHNHLHRDPPPLVRTLSSPSSNRSPTTATAHDAERAPHLQAADGGWVPTVQGRPVMGRARAATSGDMSPSAHQRGGSGQDARSAPDVGVTAAAVSSSAPANDASPREQMPSIRFIPHVEQRSSRPSLQFSAIARTLKTASNIVRVGRYSERDTTVTPEGEVTPIGFKSKVVSRRHCEFWCTDGQWYIKDVKSSSGTFLNHVRLSSPGAESRPYPVNDGDVVQLGIDFKGGEELIFRCVKIRIECNRGWQKSLNSFNTSAHRRLLKNALRTRDATRDSDVASTHSSECSICLNPVAPCQALFVAPCSHVWHYKCVRSLIQGPNYPNFLCPNCRFVADLEADVEQPEDLFDDLSSSPETGDDVVAAETQLPNADGPGQSADDNTQSEPVDDAELAGLVTSLSLDEAGDEPPPASATPTRPVAIVLPPSHHSTASPSDLLGAGGIVDGPMTPRNDVGPFVLDGAAGAGTVSMSLAAQALCDVNGSDGAQPRENDA